MTLVAGLSARAQFPDSLGHRALHCGRPRRSGRLAGGGSRGGEKAGGGQSRVAQALGAGPGFGGDEIAADLPRYRYIVGMERFDDKKNLLARHASFEAALKTVHDNLGRGLAGTSKVYEVVLPEHKIAVIGVAMNSPANGDAATLKKIGVEDRIAGYPYELFVLNREVHAFYARYRLALAFPDLGMGAFMRIVYAPEEILSTLKTVAGGQ